MALKVQLSKLSDAGLVQEYRNGNPTALEALVNRHHRSMLRYACAITGVYTLAQDALQEAWIEAWLAISNGSYREEGLFLKWLKGIVYKKAIDAKKQSRLLTHDEPPDEPDTTLNSEELIILSESTRAVNRQLVNALKRLPEEECSIVLLHYFDDLSYNAIGEKLGITAKSAREANSRAISRLKKMMNAETAKPLKLNKIEPRKNLFSKSAQR